MLDSSSALRVFAVLTGCLLFSTPLSSQILMGDPCENDCLGSCCGNGALPDCGYNPSSENPISTGTPILFDRGHGNKHSLECTYRGFRDLLAADGYVLSSTDVSDCPLTAAELPVAGDSIYVLASAKSCCAQTTPCENCPSSTSALTHDEATLISDWVRQGGSLLLILDHSPFDRLDNLLFRFGLEVVDESVRKHTFCRTNSELATSLFTQGVDAVTTFSGMSFAVSAITPVDTAHFPVLFFNPTYQGDGSSCLGQDPRLPGEGSSSFFGTWPPPQNPQELQGVALTAGAGRVYVSGEARMFTAIANDSANGCRHTGMQAADAPGNEQLLLNVIHWLDPRNG